MGAPVNQNDPRVKRTRQLLQRAFTDLIHEKGFEAITVQDIAERATLNRATFYAHFEDKYALASSTVGASLTELLRRRVADEARISEETLRSLVLAVCDYHIGLSKQCQRAHQSLEALLEAQIKATLYDLTLGCLTRTEALRQNSPETLRMAATVISWAIYGAALQWARAGQPQSAEALAETVLPLLMGGITALDGLVGTERWHNGGTVRSVTIAQDGARVVLGRP